MNGSEVLKMARVCLPEGAKLTNGARRLVKRADEAGVPPGTILQAVLSAAKKAGDEGRTRVGPFGGAQTVFEGLRSEALQKQRELLLTQGQTRRPK